MSMGGVSGRARYRLRESAAIALAPGGAAGARAPTRGSPEQNGDPVSCASGGGSSQISAGFAEERRESCEESVLARRAPLIAVG